MRNRSRSVALRSRRLSGGAGAWPPADHPTASWGGVYLVWGGVYLVWGE